MHKLHHAMAVSLKHFHRLHKMAHHIRHHGHHGHGHHGHHIYGHHSHHGHHVHHGQGAPHKKLTEMEFRERGLGVPKKHALKFRM